MNFQGANQNHTLRIHAVAPKALPCRKRDAYTQARVLREVRFARAARQPLLSDLKNLLLFRGRQVFHFLGFLVSDLFQFLE